MPNRRDFLDHLGWTGAGVVFSVSSAGVLSSPALARGQAGSRKFSFIQISDSHIGFHESANNHVADTLQKAVDSINALKAQPAFVMHTGDVTHLAQPGQFDTAKSILSTLKVPLFTVPGEHDILGDQGRAYAAAFGRKDTPGGWYAFDHHGVHFIALVNVFEKMGLLTQPQLDWLARDLNTQQSDTPIVVFGHLPLYALYPKWGWTTADGAQALAMFSRFSSVTVLNGHTHQSMEHHEGNLHFYTAASTGYALPLPSDADGPSPLLVPKDHLLSTLGYRTVAWHGHKEQVSKEMLG